MQLLLGLGGHRLRYCTVIWKDPRWGSNVIQSLIIRFDIGMILQGGGVVGGVWARGGRIFTRTDAWGRQYLHIAARHCFIYHLITNLWLKRLLPLRINLHRLIPIFSSCSATVHYVSQFRPNRAVSRYVFNLLLCKAGSHLKLLWRFMVRTTLWQEEAAIFRCIYNGRWLVLRLLLIGIYNTINSNYSRRKIAYLSCSMKN